MQRPLPGDLYRQLSSFQVGTLQNAPQQNTSAATSNSVGTYLLSAGLVWRLAYATGYCLLSSPSCSSSALNPHILDKKNSLLISGHVTLDLYTTSASPLESLLTLPCPFQLDKSLS